MVTFCTYYIAWILGGEGRGENGDCSRSVVRTVSTGCETPQCAASWMLLLYAGDSSRWLLTPSPQFLSRGAQTFWHRARAYSLQIERPRLILPLGHRSRSVAFLCARIVSCTHATMQSSVRQVWMRFFELIHCRRQLAPLLLLPSPGGKGHPAPGDCVSRLIHLHWREDSSLSLLLSLSGGPQNDTLLLSRWRGFAPQAQECMAWLKTFSCLGPNISEAYSHHAQISIWKNPKDYKISMIAEKL